MSLHLIAALAMTAFTQDCPAYVKHDPGGDYTNADFVTHVGNPSHPPQLADVTDALNDPKRSIIVNLLGVPLADRPAYFAQLLPQILAEKARTGRPHWLVIDETHHLHERVPQDRCVLPRRDQLVTVLARVTGAADAYGPPVERCIGVRHIRLIGR